MFCGALRWRSLPCTDLLALRSQFPALTLLCPGMLSCATLALLGRALLVRSTPLPCSRTACRGRALLRYAGVGWQCNPLVCRSLDCCAQLALLCAAALYASLGRNGKLCWRCHASLPVSNRCFAFQCWLADATRCVAPHCLPRAALCCAMLALLGSAMLCFALSCLPLTFSAVNYWRCSSLLCS